MVLSQRRNHFTFSITILLLSYIIKVHATLYDLRQTGETNIQIDMKDVFVLALTDGELTEDDYNYDYSDLTVKPESMITPTSPKPTLNITISNSTLTNNNNTNNNRTELHPGIPLNAENFQIPVHIIQDPQKKYISSNQIRQKQSGEDKERNCMQGFFLDSKNRCRRIKGYNQRQRPSLPFGLRFATGPIVAIPDGKS